jgi:single-strand DNA-binding protein
MAGVNHCLFIGRLGKDPEVKQAGASQVANFSIAVETKWKDKSKHTQSQVEWVQLAAWGNNAEIAKKYLKKGDEIYVETRYQNQEWEKDGQKRSRAQFVVEKFIFLGGSSKGKKPSAATAEAVEAGPDGGDDIPF